MEFRRGVRGWGIGDPPERTSRGGQISNLTYARRVSNARLLSPRPWAPCETCTGPFCEADTRGKSRRSAGNHKSKTEAGTRVTSPCDPFTAPARSRVPRRDSAASALGAAETPAEADRHG